MTKCGDPAGERERERERKTDRQEDRKTERCRQAASISSDNPAEVLLVVFMLLPAFTIISAAWSSHTARAFPHSFIVKQKSVRCLSALMYEKQRKKDLRMTKSFDHVSGSFLVFVKEMSELK